jgi:hypothetical protein
MNKIIAALVAGLFAVSVNAFAAPMDAGSKDDAAAQAAASIEKPAAAPASKKAHKAHKAHKKAAPKTEAAKPAETTAPAAK